MRTHGRGLFEVADDDLVDHARRRGMDAQRADGGHVQATKTRGERPFTRTLEDHDEVDNFADREPESEENAHMIRHDALHNMLLLETAAANWFARMSQKERQSYVKSHPRSKYAKNTGGVLAQQASRLATKSGQLRNSHAAKGGNGDAMHQRIALHHDEAEDHFRSAAQHFTSGNHKAGQAALKKGLSASNKAGALSDRAKSGRGDVRAMNKVSRQFHRDNPQYLSGGGGGKASRGDVRAMNDASRQFHRDNPEYLGGKRRASKSDVQAMRGASQQFHRDNPEYLGGKRRANPSDVKAMRRASDMFHKQNPEVLNGRRASKSDVNAMNRASKQFHKDNPDYLGGGKRSTDKKPKSGGKASTSDVRAMNRASRKFHRENPGYL